jgi:hypothetical protein
MTKKHYAAIAATVAAVASAFAEAGADYTSPAFMMTAASAIIALITALRSPQLGKPSE